MVYAGRPKNGAHTPMPSGGTWSGSRPTVWPWRSARIICRTPASEAGAVSRPGRLRAVASSSRSQALRAGRYSAVIGWRAPKRSA